MRSQSVKYIFVFMVFAVTFCGCEYLKMTYTKVKMNLSRSDDPNPENIKEGFPGKCGVLMGNIISKTPIKGPFIIVATSSQTKNPIMADYTVLSEPGPYMLYVPEGKYQIFAFEDLNDNQIYEKTEWVGQYENPRTIIMGAGQVIGELDFEISRNQTGPSASTLDLKITTPNRTGLISLERGGTVNLNHALFSKKYGSMGLWDSATFIETLGVNIYATSAFNPSKIPILFVHGSGGTPKDWEFFASNLDSERYQMWFFYYPTGLRLQTISDLLYEKLASLHNIYAFDSLFITGHSLGGLIIRTFIDRYSSTHQLYDLKLFISLATPWGGVDSAKRAPERGLFQYPPAWRDLAPGSEFIRHLFQKEFPSEIPFYLFFGYQSTKILFGGGNDGSIALRSLLDHRAQAVARKCIGFDENHVSILFSVKVVKQYKAILDKI